MVGVVRMTINLLRFVIRNRNAPIYEEVSD